ncbi:MAG: hypothetical protein AAF543_21165 [Pseudomonadota bacterium]
MRLKASAAAALSGDARVPGDKSLSHRALMLASMTVGDTVVTGLLQSDDVMTENLYLHVISMVTCFDL